MIIGSKRNIKKERGSYRKRGGSEMEPSTEFWPCLNKGRKSQRCLRGLADVGPRKAGINNSESETKKALDN